MSSEHINNLNSMSTQNTFETARGRTVLPRSRLTMIAEGGSQNSLPFRHGIRLNPHNPSSLTVFLIHHHARCRADKIDSWTNALLHATRFFSGMRFTSSLRLRAAIPWPRQRSSQNLLQGGSVRSLTSDAMHDPVSRAVVHSELSCLIFEHVRTGAGSECRLGRRIMAFTQEPAKHTSFRPPGDEITISIIENVIPSTFMVTTRSLASAFRAIEN